MKSRIQSGLAAVLGFASLLCWAPGCGGTSLGNPYAPPPPDPLTIRTGAYVSMNWFDRFVLPTAFADVFALSFCVDAVLFKATPTSAATDLYLRLGDIQITPTGQELATTTAPVGTYERVEFSLNAGCVSGKSMQVLNDQGAYSTTQTFGMNFVGQISIDGSTQVLTLNLQPYIDALNGVSSDAGIKPAIQSTAGTF